MKKGIIAIVVMVMMSTTAMAQTDEGDKKGRKFDSTELVTKRTEDIAKKYGLDETQKAQLLELNKKYAKNMRPMRPMPPRRGDKMERPDEFGKDSVNRPKPTDEQKAEMDERRKQMEDEMTEYNKELQKIMTDSQYKSYQADMQKRMLQRPRR